MYKDILIILQARVLNESLIKFASDMAGSYKAGLKVVLVNPPVVENIPIAGFGMGGAVTSVAEGQSEEEVKLTSAQCRDHIGNLLGDVASNVTFFAIAGTQFEIDRKIVNFARTTDLFICFNPLTEGVSPFDRYVFELVLHQGACGVYVTPRDLPPVGYAQSIVVAWNLSREAARATSYAMPLLAKAREVSILLVDPDLRHAGDDWQPGKQLLDHLTRHEVRAKLAQVSSANLSVADAIAAELNSKEARLVVMGGYGKNALADWLLGSVARQFLEHSKVPILMAT